MKKTLTVLWAMAFGIGAVAQAQVVRNGEAERLNKNIDLKVSAEFIETSEAGGVSAQLKANGPAYDTLLWHDEYTNDDCSGTLYMLPYGVTSLFGDEMALSPFGASFNGTGEVGATYQTEDKLYDNYARINVANAWVVGATAYVYRLGSTTAWERLGVDAFDPEHINEYEGVKVPALPFTIKGYPKVERQQAVASYWDLFWGDGEYLVDMEMPVSMQDAVESKETGYINYYGPHTLEDGRVQPWLQRIAGMFDEVFPANANFGLSIQAHWTNDKTYDSLWNWSMLGKPNSACAFIDGWAAWQRIDFSESQKHWVWLYMNDGSDIDVSKPYDTEDDDWGFAPNDCPQHDNGTGLYVYAFCMNMRLDEGEHMLPTLYPIIQDRATIERNKDAYVQTVSVYPLPAADKVNIVALDEIQRVEIYNMAGTLVKAIPMNDIHLELDVTSFAPGTYIAKITTEKGVASKKLLVK